MAWKHSAVTNDGVEMLNGLMAGRKLTVTSAYGGTGFIDLETEKLEEQTGLVEQKQQLVVLDVENTEEGKIVCIQISNLTVEEGYKLNQILVNASLEGEAERPLFIMQDEIGANIPTKADTPSFLLEVYATIRITNGVKLEVVVDGAGIATREFVQKYVATALKENADNNPGNTQTASGPPTGDTAGTPGQHYFDTETGTEYICTGTDENGKTIWKETGIKDADDITYNGKPLTDSLDKFVTSDKLSGLMASGGIVKTILFSIPADGWAEDEEASGGYRYYYDLLDDAITANMLPDTTITEDSLTAAKQAGMCPVAATYDGFVRYKCAARPTAEISASCTLSVKGTYTPDGGSSTYELPAATSLSLGGVKIPANSGLKIDPEGNLSVDTPTDEEAGDAIGEVFGDTP